MIIVNIFMILTNFYENKLKEIVKIIEAKTDKFDNSINILCYSVASHVIAIFDSVKCLHCDN